MPLKFSAGEARSPRIECHQSEANKTCERMPPSMGPTREPTPHQLHMRQPPLYCLATIELLHHADEAEGARAVRDDADIPNLPAVWAVSSAGPAALRSAHIGLSNRPVIVAQAAHDAGGQRGPIVSRSGSVSPEGGIRLTQTAHHIIVRQLQSWPNSRTGRRP